MSEDGDGGCALTVEFNCGRVRGFLEVQDGMFGRRVEVYLYDKPMNLKVADWRPDA